MIEIKVGGIGFSKSIIRSDIEFSNFIGDIWDIFLIVVLICIEVF